MKAIRAIATLAAAAMLAVAFSPVRANAQGVVRGTFKLESQARWGSANLAPGSYRFEVLAPAGSNDTVREVIVQNRTEEKSPIYILGLVDGNASSTEANALLCLRWNSTCFVRTLQLGVTGETLYFPIRRHVSFQAEKHNRKTRTLQAKAHEPVQRVPISISGK